MPLFSMGEPMLHSNKSDLGLEQGSTPFSAARDCPLLEDNRYKINGNVTFT